MIHEKYNIKFDFNFREAIAVVESLKKTRADLESKAGVYKPDELYSLLQVNNEMKFHGYTWSILL